MKPKRVLVIYKRSAYKVYFLEKRSSFLRKHMKISAPMLSEFKKAHIEHYKALDEVLRVLRKDSIRYTKASRGRKADFKKFDFVISVGGDGTFLEAVRGIKKQIILGVNSDPQRSIGRYCAANRFTFEKIFGKVIANKAKILKLNRIKITINGHSVVNALNDVLICHSNPAALSRYLLAVDTKREEQRSSGLWISTASGSSGAIKSAGGRILNVRDRSIQYRPRELLNAKHLSYKLTGGVLEFNRSLKVLSLMRRGMMYIDGTHISFPFHFGDVAIFSSSSNFIQTIYL